MKYSENLGFSAGLLDRAAHLRTAPDALEDRKTAGRFLPLWRGKPLIQHAPEGPARLALLPQDHPMIARCTEAPIFLGLSDGNAYFACVIPDWETDLQPDTNSFVDTAEYSHPNAPDGARFLELRQMLTALSPAESEIAATARAILEWHRSHPFCSCCGARSDIAEEGWQRNCPSCGRMHFPRTDPVVIMLITHGNNVLVGRSPGWPEGMYSLLAGFMEPGETIEAATRREVFEETGVRVGEVSYLASQPWPFPASLMIGTRGVALTRDITLDRNELEDARWLSREDMMQAFAGQLAGVTPARTGSIAHFLLRNWLADR